MSQSVKTYFIGGLLTNNQYHEFFPAAGYGSVISLYDAGFVGRYWSKTLGWTLKSTANFFEFDTNEHIKINGYDRWDGYSIRPVKDIN